MCLKDRIYFQRDAILFLRSTLLLANCSPTEEVTTIIFKLLPSPPCYNGRQTKEALAFNVQVLSPVNDVYIYMSLFSNNRRRHRLLLLCWCAIISISLTQLLSFHWLPNCRNVTPFVQYFEFYSNQAPITTATDNSLVLNIL